MASKLNKKYSANATGILGISPDGIITVEVEDIDEPISLADFFQDFVDKDVKISIAYNEEI